MYYLIYKTTNNINGMYYIGCHQTDNIDDEYLGSGKYLRRAILFYGKENFSKEILHECLTAEEMFSKETETVNEDVVKDKNSYNLKIGGSGGNPGIVGAFSGRKHKEESKEKIRQSALLQGTSEEKRKKLSKNNWSKRDPEAHRAHMIKISKMPRSEEHNRKVAEANLGKILINNGEVAKRINKDDFSFYEESGWKKGGMPRKL